ncbi:MULTISPECIES: LysR family transcriptional regulator [Vibrio]|jgi:DNA-binding transcriptional LysR family regulator|uniref:LysR family transcriptional regulator n=1 Tax=Vibrio natriegens NBRC 15636 = ATCC 14048 = DSM 759 TaxID=1219067 RepID=A0AAN0Y6F2_VIBNA|nr:MULTISPECIES: LysR family transcriptional regulator [Vibrio]MEE3877438.1 LysR family transcriptional regulator [Vibrio sp. YYF0003]WMN89665.1 LysR family transcriptional regulator [Vibrio parahaemolyticus]CAH0525890.1 HTH-type transcriptional regulator DmlR [Catenococcus thiocycli]AEX25101.1 LysR family transcriptional regulator [Vibrio sp. EJY3]ALR17372.1 LysR family transcriptional regulator [Vibrio natriegens NBRC 15636 = ATCC 14048 = DSM 759]
MRADDLILFSQVMELGSFSKVAEANNLTNSVVSKRIARLEEEIGAQLLYRTTRKLTLTEAGKVLLHSAKNVKQATQEAMDAVAGFGENVSGHIKMSVPSISGDLILADAVAEFCNLHPGLTVDMSLDNRFVDLVADGYDLVIRTGYLEDSSLIARHILDSQWVVCASPSYIAKNGKPVEPIDLTRHNCFQYAYQTTGASDWEFKSDEGNYIVKVSGSFSTDNATALRKAALGGHGIAYVPRCLVYHDIRNGQLVDIFPELVGKKLGIYAVYPFTRQPPNKVKLLIEHIRDRYLTISHYF